MRKKGKFVICVLFVVIVVLSLGVISEAAEQVKIGFIWPLTGGSSTIGCQHNDGALMAIEEINRNGGVKSLGGAKIVPIVADSQTIPDVGATQAERLIVVEKVPLIVGAYNSSVTFAATEVAERYQTPWISMGAVKDEITERGFKWIFRVNNKATYDMKEMVVAIELFEKETGEKVETIGHLYEATDWGSDAARILRNLAEEKGWKIVVDESVVSGTADMTSQILKIKKANPDVMFVSLYTPEHILFNRTYASYKVYNRLGLWSVGGGAQDPAFYDALPVEAVEYMFVQDDWDSNIVKRYDWAKKLAKEVKERFGYPMNDFFAQGWTAAYVAYMALEKAGSTDKEAIRKALTEIDITDPRALLTGYSRVKFDENGQNTYSHGTIAQRQKNEKGEIERVVLWPLECRMGDERLIWPIPAWNER